MLHSFRKDMQKLLVLTAVAGLAHSARATDLSNNLSSSSSGTETASGNRWLTASFGTGTAAHTLSSITLLLANTSAGTAQVSIYSNGGLEPGTLVGSLTPPASYSSTPAPTTFTTSGIALAANTTYWIVLRAVSGTFTWAWTSDNSGSGAGFQHTWGFSEDGGAFWWTYDTYPTQFRIVVDVCALPGDMTGDGAVDGADVQPFVNCLMGSGTNCGCGDFDGNGSVGASDVPAFATALIGPS